METSLKTRGVPWSITNPCLISGTGAQPTHRACIATAPCQIRRLCQDGTGKAHRPGCP